MRFIKKSINFLSTHGLGLRTIKTVLGVTVCLVGARLVSYKEMPFYACITAVIVMQTTPSESITVGIERLVGTVIGGLSGMVSLWIMQATSVHLFVMVPLSLTISIMVCNLIRLKKASGMCAVMLLGILLLPTRQNIFLYGAIRTAETAIGIVITVIINYSIRSPKAQISNGESAQLAIRDKAPKLIEMDDQTGKAADLEDVKDADNDEIKCTELV